MANLDEGDASPQARFGAGLRALVVDDEATIRFAVREILEEVGFEVLAAGDLAEGRAHLAAAKFDLLLLDRNLPDGSGLDLAWEQPSGGPDCAVILISASANLASAVEALRCGVADYIFKPFDLDDLVARVRRVIVVQKLSRAHEALLGELHQKTTSLEAQVVRDPLTQLFNHVHFQESLDTELVRSRRHGLKLGLVLLDVDGFKQVNDHLGHQTGDAVLRGLGALLRESGRRSDLSFRLRENDIAARYGGDEFALLLPETPKAGVACMAERLREHVEQHGLGVEQLHRVTLSVGVAGFPEDGNDRDTLIQAADRALYAAKRAGKNRLVTYSAALGATGEGAALEATRLAALERTIDEHTVSFVYQPLVAITGRAVVGYEALCRPTDPAFATPLDLIGAAERAGRVAALGRVLRERLAQGLAELPEAALLFVNLHPQELFDQALRGAEAPLTRLASRTVLELIQTSEITDFGRARDAITQARSLGFRVAVDGPGPGYTGMSHLDLLRPDFVKLDVATLRETREQGRTARLVGHLLDVARDEGMRVVAKRVETAADLELLGALGIELAQGFVIAPPAAAFVTPRPVPDR